MDLSNIKKIVLEEGRVVIIDGDDALVVMSFDEYRKTKVLPKVEIQETKVIPADIPQQQAKAEAESPSEIKSELTLDDLPF